MNMKIIVSLLVLACCEAARPSLEKQVDRMAERLGRLEAELAAKDERIAALERASRSGSTCNCPLSNRPIPTSMATRSC